MGLILDNLKKVLTKKIEIPVTNNVREVEAVQLWEVRWMARHGAFSNDTREQVEVFMSEQDADDFATALKNATKLLRHTENPRITAKRCGNA